MQLISARSFNRPRRPMSCAARALRLSLLAVFALCAIELPTPDRASAEAMVVVTDSGCLRLRIEPSLAASVVTCLAPGTPVEVGDGVAEADGYTWRRITARGYEGWAASTFLVAAAEGGVSPTPSAPTDTNALAAFPTPPPGGLTIGRAGVDSVDALIAAQPFDVAAAFVFDVDLQRFRMHTVALVTRLGTAPITLAADDVVLLHRADTPDSLDGLVTPSSFTAADAADAATAGTPLVVPPHGGITTGIATASGLDSVIAHQRFTVDLVMTWDVPGQRWLSYRPDAPAFTNSLTSDAVAPGIPVFMRRHPTAPDPVPPASEPLPEAPPPPLSSDPRDEEISFYYCERGENPDWWGDGGGWCGHMANGEIVHEGAAGCARDRMGEQFVIAGDPLARTYTCKDTGGGVRDGFRDIWFPDSDSGRTWWNSVGPRAVVIPID